MFQISTSHLITIILISLSQHRLAISHNWLVEPYAFNTNWRTSDCEGSECTNACPKIMQPKDMMNMREEPAATWKRGQRVRVCYARNNHHGGIARFSLVPVNVMNSRFWHKRFTLFHTCFGAGAVKCRHTKTIKTRQNLQEDPPCGTDRGCYAYCRNVTVPNMLPDGNYVLGHVWYGGVHFKKTKGHFADYYSCSFIEIKGGEPYRCGWKSSLANHKPYFDSNKDVDGVNVKDGKCLTSATSIGVCDKTGCPDETPVYAIPRVFDYRKGPDGFTCNDVWTAFEKSHTKDMNLLMGICKGDVCCPKACGTCGGEDCSKRLPGEVCCGGYIRKSERYCNRHEPPCIRD